MKHFNFTKPNQEKWFLTAGLLLALATSLNLDPEATHIAKNERSSQAIELASVGAPTAQSPTTTNPAESAAASPATGATKPKEVMLDQVVVKGKAEKNTEQPLSYGEIELGEFDQSLKGVKVRYALNGSSTVASYNLEGESTGVCNTCVGIQEMPIKKEDLSQIEFFKRALAKHALENIEKKSARKPQAPTTNEKPKGTSIDLATSCDMEIADGLLSCQRDELKALVEKCQTSEGKKDNKCITNAQAFYRKHLQKNLMNGLSSGTNSELFNEAQEVRDDLIAELPSKFDRTIRADLINLTTKGVLSRGERTYNRCLMTGCLPGYAATLAKSQMQSEINPYNRFAVGGRLASALTDYGMSSKSGSPDAMQDVFMSSFYNPVFELVKQNSEKGMRFNLIGSTDGFVGEVGPNGQPQAPGLQTPNQQPQYPSSPYGRQGSRTQVQVPGAYGTPRTNGGPNMTGGNNGYPQQNNWGPQQNTWGTQQNMGPNMGQQNSWGPQQNSWGQPQTYPAAMQNNPGLRARRF